MLADGGVCIIDNLTSHKKDTEILQKALETGEIGMNMLKQVDAHASSSHDRSWKLNCTIWAQVDQQHRKRQYANADCNVIGEFSVQVGDCNVYAQDFSSK